MIEKVRNAITEPLNKEGISVDKIYLGKENGVDTLFIVVDADVVDLDMCVKATEIINPIIDNLDIELENYLLDVSGKVGEEDEC